MNKEKLEEVLNKHNLWLNREEAGIRADLSGVDLRSADLKYADLRYVNLRYADLSGADLSDANLIHANLSDANLSGADLSRVNLSRANLSRANLSGTNLNWTTTQDIEGINVISIQFNTTRKNNKLSYWVELGIWITGCFQGNEQELRKSIEEKHRDSKLGLRYLSAIDYMKSLVD